MGAALFQAMGQQVDAARIAHETIIWAHSMKVSLSTLIAKAKGRVKRQTTVLAYQHLALPLKEKTFELAQEQCLAHAADALEIFGNTTLRGFLSDEEVKEIAAGLEEIGAGFSCQETVLSANPVEKSVRIQHVVFSASFLSILNKLLPPFWYYASDSCIGLPEFTKHRDTIYAPPFLKVFIPLSPCTFAILPGSHWPGDSYSRRVGKHASNWDSGNEPTLPASEVHFQSSKTKQVADISYLAAEDLFLHRHLSPGDVFVFNQCAVHGLKADLSRNFFLALTLVPSPVAASRYGLTRTQHVEAIIENIVSSSACEYHLSKGKKIDPEECLFSGYKFSEQDLDRLTSGGSSGGIWNNCFGLRFIEKEKWQQAFEQNRHLAFQRLQNTL